MSNISPLMLEDNIIYLENAKKLMNIYFEFIDTECPHNLKENSQQELEKAIIYAQRTEQFLTAFLSALDFVRQAKENLEKIVYNK